MNEKPIPTRAASFALLLGVIAMIAVPLSFRLLLEPATNLSGYEPVVRIVQFGALVAGLGAFLLGRSARRSGDRSDAAIWGPRLGGAALIGFVLLLLGAGSPFVVATSESGWYSGIRPT